MSCPLLRCPFTLGGLDALAIMDLAPPISICTGLCSFPPLLRSNIRNALGRDVHT